MRYTSCLFLLVLILSSCSIYGSSNGKLRYVRSENEEIAVLDKLDERENHKEYLFQIATWPNFADYEFTINVEYNTTDEYSIHNMTLNEKTISRINAYQNQEDCVKNDFPDLRKFCFCKTKAHSRN